MRIVLADDSGTARMFFRRCLEIAGCSEAEFLEAKNGQEAYDLIAKGPVDLVVTDLNMPVMDGLALLARLKETPGMQNVPVLVITSAASDLKIQELREAGAWAVMSKPVTPAGMAQVVKAIFGEEVCS